MEYSYNFEPYSLAGKVVLLAGGTGGLGAATAALLAREGAKLVIGYRSNHQHTNKLQESLASLTSAVSLIDGDLTEPATVGQYIQQAVSLWPLTAVALFPGDPARIAAQEAPTEAQEIARLQHSWNQNFIGPYRLAQKATRQMASQGTGGSIVFISTMQATVPFRNNTAYAAPKAALQHAARVLAAEFGGEPNIFVNVVAPGVTTSGMARSSVASGKYEPFVKNGIIPRYGGAEDIARAVRFLLSPDSYITGQIITVDGGLTLRR